MTKPPKPMKPAEFKRIRTATGHTQKKLGIFLGYAGNSAEITINRMENGKRPIPAHVAVTMRLLNDGAKARKA